MAERIFPNAIRMAELVREGKIHQNENDCVPNAAELVEQMRLCADEKSVHCKECKFVDTVNNMCMNIMVNCAADCIEQLLAENAKLKAERDAIRDALVAGGTYCDICKKYISCPSSEDCKGEKFEWRGVQKEKEDG